LKYNIFLQNQYGSSNILNVDRSELEKIIDVYKYGKDSLFIKGKKYLFHKLIEIQIFTFEHEQITSEEDLLGFCKQNNLIDSGIFGLGEYLPVKTLQHFGKRITDIFITDNYGCLKETKIEVPVKETYVDLDRINEITNLDNDSFDFTKLIAFLKELNSSYFNSSYLSIPLLVRAIIDHIPPIFGKEKFAEVCNNYGSRSFKENMNNLNNSSRKIADSFLHSRIRKQENLPNITQINFRNDLDVLLQEIVRIKKN